MSAESGSPTEPGLEDLLAFLRDSRGLDFTGYKRATLTRRIRKRMSAVDVDEFAAYRDFLEVQPDEQARLVDTILINVTGFLRDEEAWSYLSAEILPVIVDRQPDGAPIRVWSAGCSTGEEAFSLAMVLADHLGIEEFRQRVKIYATDTDESALVRARTGRYSAHELEAVPAAMRERFFEPAGNDFVFRADCRRSVIFGRHDITRDAPISRLDLLVCRNVLMYLVRDAQRGVLSRFHYSLNPSGFLFLGRAETILAHEDLFKTVEAQHRVFRRVDDGPSARDQLLAIGGQVGLGAGAPHQLRQLAALASPVAQLVVDIDGLLVEANTRARALFGVAASDVGRPFRDLEVSFRPIELRSRIEQAYAESHSVTLRAVDRPLPDGSTQYLDVTIAPLVDPAGIALGANITFADVTELARTKVDLERAARDLELSNESLHSTNEELETSNEELQSINEELETTNEELQSANEELETMNEELRSANEELEAMNEELIDQATRIEASGLFLSGLLNSLPNGLVVVDDELDIVVWNRAMEDLFGLRIGEVTGKSFLAIETGLPVGAIAPLLHAARSEAGRSNGDVVVDAVTRIGTAIRCRVRVMALGDGGPPESGRVVILVDSVAEDGGA